MPRDKQWCENISKSLKKAYYEGRIKNPLDPLNPNYQQNRKKHQDVINSWQYRDKLSKSVKKAYIDGRKKPNLTPDVRRKITETLLGHPIPTKEELQKLYIDLKLTQKQIGKILDISEWSVFKWMRYYGIPARQLKENANPRAGFEGMLKKRTRPNKIERTLDELLQNNFPGEWKYTGSGKNIVRLAGRYPDWTNINGRKAVIELFSELWHNPKYNKHFNPRLGEDKTIDDYRRFGFDCLIIWAKELEEPEKVITKVREFVNAK